MIYPVQNTLECVRYILFEFDYQNIHNSPILECDPKQKTVEPFNIYRSTRPKSTIEAVDYSHSNDQEYIVIRLLIPFFWCNVIRLPLTIPILIDIY